LKLVIDGLAMVDNTTYVVEWVRGPDSFTSKEIHFFTTLHEDTMGDSFTKISSFYKKN
jgi:hypothetical protein